jgi:DNA-binding NarL/FixJ family response regulator
MSISVLLVDDHIIFRESIRALLEVTTDFKIVGEASNGVDALAQVDQLRPNVMILDYLMPNLSGLEVVSRLQKQRTETHVVFLSMHNDESYVLNAVQNGASGYILKEDIVAHLARAITAAAAGQYYFSPSLRERAFLSEWGNLAARKGLPGD